MKFLGGIHMGEGTSISNMTLPIGNVLPLDENVGELFYLKSHVSYKNGIYLCEESSDVPGDLAWKLILQIDAGVEQFPIIELGSTSAVSILATQDVPLRWNFQSRLDADCFLHDTSVPADSSKITVLRRGLFQVSYVLNTVIEKKSDQLFSCFLRVNGNQVIGRSSTSTRSLDSTNPTTNTTSFMIHMYEGDYIELIGRVDSLKGTKVSVITVAPNSAMSLTRLGDL